MHILVIGGGGREHALAWKLRQSPRVDKLVVAPGNAGTAGEPGVHNAAVAASDLDGLLALARTEKIELTVVGPEVPLVTGVVDRFRQAGRRIFGPDARAAKLEGSKIFTKDFLHRHHIPTARYAAFTTLPEALAYVRQQGVPIVIKADGLAAGKGVVVAHNPTEAQQALHDMLGAHAFGDASARVVIEDYLAGEEISYMVLSDGTHALPMASSKDHKRRDEGGLGPNTGGMGACSPAPVMTPEVEQRILTQIIEPALHGMASEGTPFIGVLYAGLMIDDQGQPRLIEFNVRFGDPEAQAIMLRLNSDLVDLIQATLDGILPTVQTQWDRRSSVGVVMASAGYPGPVRMGQLIDGLATDWAPDTKVFYAGATHDARGQVVTSGGRVLTVCALGTDMATARQKAYARMETIHFDGAFWRRDIAQ